MAIWVTGWKTSLATGIAAAGPVTTVLALPFTVRFTLALAGIAPEVTLGFTIARSTAGFGPGAEVR